MTRHTTPWAHLPWLGMVIALVLSCPGIAMSAVAITRSGAATGSGDQTLSPYFFVTSDDAELDQLPLKQTWAEVDIAGVIADVTVVQRYENEGDTTLEAIYVFPASTRAAVYAMTMTVGERVIEAEIQEREQARETYEQAKQRGQTTSLLEQQRPNVFQMNVANILPGDEIEVELSYTELLVPTDGVYEFVYPTVVGPRYSNVPANGAPDTEKWVANPYLHDGVDAPQTFAMDLRLHTGIPLARLTSPSHDLDVDYLSDREADVLIAESAEAGNRDVVIQYALAGDDVESGLLLLPPTAYDEGYFLLMVEPPARVATAQVVPREYIFVLDVSGSMHGFPLDVSMELMNTLLGQLRPSDHFNILFFAGTSALLSEHSLPATKDNIDGAIDAVQRQGGGGGTELLPALQRAMDLPVINEGVARVIVVATDGYVSVEPQAFEVVRERGDEASVFAFGIGSSVNRFLIEGLARAGMGEPFVALDESSARTMARRFETYVKSPVLTDIEVTFDGAEVFDVEPLAVPDLFAERPIVVFGRYEGELDGEIVVSGQTADGWLEQVIDTDDAVVADDSDALRFLWARQRIARLSDMNNLQADDERVDEVTELGLHHGLLTAYTSFVAVDKRRRGNGDLETVTQPLPLPEGVSDSAVGGLAGGVIGSQYGHQYGSGGLGLRGSGSGQGGGGTDVSLGTLGTRGRGRGASGFGGGGAVAFPEGKGGGATVIEMSVPDGEPIILGSLDRTIIDRVMKQHLNEIRHCYEKGLKSNPNLAGKVVFKLVIGPDGSVTSVKVSSSTLNDPQVEREIMAVIQSMAFPAPKGGGVVVVTYPFVFSSSSGSE